MSFMDFQFQSDVTVMGSVSLICEKFQRLSDCLLWCRDCAKYSQYECAWEAVPVAVIVFKTISVS